MRFALLFAGALLLMQRANAEHTIQANIATPSMGWVFDSESRSLRLVSGTLGAAIAGAPFDLGFPLRTAVIASGQAIALGISSVDDAVYLISLNDGAPTSRRIESLNLSPDKIVLSSSGTAAILYYQESATVQVLTKLTADVSVGQTVSLHGLGGSIENLAINDAGDRILISIREREGTALWMLNEGGSIDLLPIRALNVVANFQPTTREAITVTNNGEMFFIRSNATERYPTSADDGDIPVAAQFTSTENSVLIVYKSGVIVEINTATGTLRRIACGCEPTGLHRMDTSSVYRINDYSTSPLLLIEQTRSEPRLWFIPPSTHKSTIERGER